MVRAWFRQGPWFGRGSGMACGSGMVRAWFGQWLGHGSGMVRAWFGQWLGHGSGMACGSGVVRAWFGRGSGMCFCVGVIKPEGGTLKSAIFWILVSRLLFGAAAARLASPNHVSVDVASVSSTILVSLAVSSAYPRLEAM